MNAKKNEDDRRHHSAKEAVALMRQPPIIYVGIFLFLHAMMVEYYPAYLSGLGSAFRHRISLVKPLVNEVPDT